MEKEYYQTREWWIRFFVGPLLFAVISILPVDIAFKTKAAVGVLAWTAAWWIAAPVPLGVTCFLPIVIVGFIRLGPLKDVATNYAHPLVFLIAGASMLFISWTRWGLDRRVALFFLRTIGVSTRRQILVWLVTSALISIVIPDIAVVAMLGVLAVAMLTYLGYDSVEKISQSKFASSVIIAVGWGSSIGGFGTPLGGSMNIVALGVMEKYLGKEIYFIEWTLTALPVVLIILAACAVYMYLAMRPEIDTAPGSKDYFTQEARKLGPMNAGEKWGLLIFCVAVGMVFCRPLYAKTLPLLSVPVIFVIAGAILFFLPAGNGERVANWSLISKLPWNALFFVGAGLALSYILKASKAMDLLLLGVKPIVVMGKVYFSAALAIVGVVPTQFLGNTPTNAINAPWVAELAKGLRLNPIPFVYLVAAAGNMAFALPSGGGQLALTAGFGANLGQMLKHGLIMAVLTLLLLTVYGYLFMLP